MSIIPSSISQKFKSETSDQEAIKSRKRIFEISKVMCRWVYDLDNDKSIKSINIKEGYKQEKTQNKKHK